MAFHQADQRGFDRAITERNAFATQVVELRGELDSVRDQLTEERRHRDETARKNIRLNDTLREQGKLLRAFRKDIKELEKKGK
jgi:dynactin complex subunit